MYHLDQTQWFKWRYLIILLVTCLLISGCGPSPEEQQATAAVQTAAAVTDTPVPTATSTPTPTPTPVPEPLVGSVLLSEVDGMKMVYIPGGTFLQGSTDQEIDQTHKLCQENFDNCPRDAFEDEYPQHEVNLEPFWVDQIEVTTGMYLKCVADDGCQAPEPSGFYAYIGYFDDPSYENLPVTFINWQDANDYCTWVGRRLLTESEWEKAARGPDGWLYPWGNTDVRGELLNYRDINYAGKLYGLSEDDGYKRSAPVGSYPAGASLYGVEDMAGNVIEWVEDWYDIYPGGDPDSSEYFGQEGRSVRGGSWTGYFFEMYSAHRWVYYPEAKEADLGFRCALSHTAELRASYEEQQNSHPQSTLTPMQTAVAMEGTDSITGSSEGECKFIDIKAFPGWVGIFTEEEIPVFGYEASGFVPGERVEVQMTGVTESGFLSLTNIVTDRPYANGKGLIDGILVWSEVTVGGTIPSKLDISLNGEGCSLFRSVTWP